MRKTGDNAVTTNYWELENRKVATDSTETRKLTLNLTVEKTGDQCNLYRRILKSCELVNSRYLETMKGEAYTEDGVKDQ